ncbi:MAG: hypothetical protein U1D99_04125 [Candidatus Omnitrophota bacterium]|nr:hypothetical protein [Candidatus Omnitrophota bacterium]
MKEIEEKTREAVDTPERRIQILSILTHHVGRENAIGMGELYYKIFGKAYVNRINDTRPLRIILKRMKQQGSQICSHTSAVSGGYYLAAATSERDDYYDREFKNAVGRLARLGKVKKMNRQELAAQTLLLLESYDAKEEDQAY